MSAERALKILPEFGLDDLRVKTNELLEDCKKDGYETVIVMGFKDDEIRIRCSRLRSKLELVGALEVVKSEVWSE